MYKIGSDRASDEVGTNSNGFKLQKFKISNNRLLPTIESILLVCNQTARDTLSCSRRWKHRQLTHSFTLPKCAMAETRKNGKLRRRRRKKWRNQDDLVWAKCIEAQWIDRVCHRHGYKSCKKQQQKMAKEIYSSCLLWWLTSNSRKLTNQILLRNECKFDESYGCPCCCRCGGGDGGGDRNGVCTQRNTVAVVTEDNKSFEWAFGLCAIDVFVNGQKPCWRWLAQWDNGLAKKQRKGAKRQ